MARAPQTDELGPNEIATWTIERTDDQIRAFLGSKMAALALENSEAEDDEEVGLYDLMTV